MTMSAAADTSSSDGPTPTATSSASTAAPFRVAPPAAFVKLPSQGSVSQGDMYHPIYPDMDGNPSQQGYRMFVQRIEKSVLPPQDAEQSREGPRMASRTRAQLFTELTLAASLVLAFVPPRGPVASVAGSPF